MRRHFILVLSITFLSFVTVLFINNSPSVGKTTEVSPTVNPEIQVENDKILQEMENFLFGDNGIINQVREELLGKGYEFSTALVFHSK